LATEKERKKSIIGKERVGEREEREREREPHPIPSETARSKSSFVAESQTNGFSQVTQNTEKKKKGLAGAASDNKA
jgi:hypothetical protein